MPQAQQKRQHTAPRCAQSVTLGKRRFKLRLGSTTKTSHSPINTAASSYQISSNFCVARSSVNYALDANGAMTTDGLRAFNYDEANRLSKVNITKDGQAASVQYLTNAMGQRVFKSEITAGQTLPNETSLGTDFITYLKRTFGWLFANAQANTSIGTAYTYADGQLPNWALLGEYDNGSAAGKGRSEYIWLPTDDGNAIPVGMYRNGRFFAIHPDHLGTPRLMTNDQNKPVWQWPYSAFGNNKPTGVLKATPNPRAALTNQPVLLRATGAVELNLRMPGQYFDEESGLFYNWNRMYQSGSGSYTQMDPIGLGGGLNRRGYVEGSPLSHTDALGLQKGGGPSAGGAYGKLYPNASRPQPKVSIKHIVSFSFGRSAIWQTVLQSTAW